MKSDNTLRTIILTEEEQSYLEYLVHRELYGLQNSPGDILNEEEEYWENTTDASHHVKVGGGILVKLMNLEKAYDKLGHTPPG